MMDKVTGVDNMQAVYRHDGQVEWKHTKEPWLKAARVAARVLDCFSCYINEFIAEVRRVLEVFLVLLIY